MLNQKLQQKLVQKLSPQQIQLMKLLQVPGMALEQRIKQEVEENPALEEGAEEENSKENDIEDESINEDTDKTDSEDDEFDFSDYLDEDDTPYYKLAVNNSNPNEKREEIPFSVGVSFQEILMSQLGLEVLDDRQYIITSHIIGSIDESGYLRRDITAMVDDLAFSQNITTSSEEIFSLLKIIQDFDPAGVAARNLQECLLIQLKRKDLKAKVIDNAILIVEKYFDAFAKKHYEKIIKKLNISEKELRLAIDEILKLNPKPGNSLTKDFADNHYIIPDFIINNPSEADGNLELTLNSKDIPDLRINKTYLNMLKTYSKDKTNKDALLFIKQKIDSAKWFVDAINQRQKTLYITMNAMMNYQKEYFLSGDDTKLRPMILKNIAEIVNLDISTISRVASSKYVQTPFGTFLLKKFFSESMQTVSGKEVSTREVKKILQNCVDAENKKKPVTDEKLAMILKEKGYNIARRTVAKYREQLSIPVARLRKEL
jgi:RNA polymerase sigma-54 factor